MNQLMLGDVFPVSAIDPATAPSCKLQPWPSYKHEALSAESTEILNGARPIGTKPKNKRSPDDQWNLERKEKWTQTEATREKLLEEYRQRTLKAEVRRGNLLPAILSNSPHAW